MTEKYGCYADEGTKAVLFQISIERDKLRQQLTQQAAVIEQMRDVLEDVRGNINPERGFADELELDVAKVIYLQPCPEVLNKVRADAVREAVEEVAHYSEFDFLEYAQRIEKGEA